MDSPAELTPQERLAISRRAIVKHMTRHHKAVPRIENDDDDSVDLNPASHGRLAMMKHAVQVWWHRHPANAVLDLARPLLSDYARAHPAKLLGISAGVGAAIVVIRPWRMMGAVLLAAVKSSGVTSALISTLSSFMHHPENTGATP